jgi:uncharacterized membrane protein YphA (DoxX/SURF4 family)
VESIDRLHCWATGQPLLRVFTLIVRVLLATAFVPSGLVKILDQPFTTLPTTDPVGYFFAGFFSAHGFYRFVGVAQWLAAGMLLIPRTATLGAFLYLPIITNIFAITVAIGPAFAFTRVITGMMLSGALYLLFWDWDRWRDILPFTRPALNRHGDPLTILALLIAAVVVFQGVAAVHLARLRHTALAVPLSGVAIGGALGVAMLLRAYRHARRRD